MARMHRYRWAVLLPLVSAAPDVQQGSMEPGVEGGRRPVEVWRPVQRPRLTNIFWSHIPKTSTTFARTIFAYACGVDSDDFSLDGTEQPPRPTEGACTGSLSTVHDDLVNRTHGYNVTWYHMGVPWTLGATPRPSVNAVLLMREPTARLHSEYHHLSTPEGYLCCGEIEAETLPGQGWGWTRAVREKAVSIAHGKMIVGPRDWEPDPSLTTSAAKLQRYQDTLVAANSLYGCQTKMLIGRGCHESYALTSQDVERARQYVRSPQLAFAGLMERYMESVCLFHALHGEPMYDFEVFLGAPAPNPYVLDQAQGAGLVEPYVAARLKAEFDQARADGTFDGTTAADFNGGDQDPDIEIYALVRQRFEAALAEHRDHVQTCVRAAHEHGKQRQISLQE
jgi:hypothetical protein